MKRRWIGLGFFFLLYLSGYSQVDNDKGFISVALGPSFPLGDYASKDLENVYAGYAGIGEFVNISYSRLIGKYFGFSAALHGQRNPLNTRELEKDFSTLKINTGGIWAGPTPFPPPTLPFTYTVYPDWKFEKDAWLSGSLLLGGYGQFPFQKRNNISFIEKAMLGVIYVSSPGLNGSSITDTATAHVEQKGSTGFGMAWSLYGGLKFDKGKILFLSASLECSGSNKIKFKDIKSTITTTKGSPGSPGYSAQQTTVTVDGKQNINSLNFYIGIGLRLL